MERLKPAGSEATGQGALCWIYRAQNPAIHLKMLARDFPFDTVQMPLNALDATFRGFEQQVLPEATKRGVAVLGMKSLGGSGEIVVNGAVTVRGRDCVTR